MLLRESKEIEPQKGMKNLFLSELMAGANVWHAQGHVMSGSNDWEVRKEVFKWIADHEKTFYSPRQAVDPIGVYFSPRTRNYFPEPFIWSYRGMMLLLLQSHREFQVVTSLRPGTWRASPVAYLSFPTSSVVPQN